MSHDLRNIIVTGGTRGIGASIVQAFLEYGDSVVATYVGNDEEAKKFASKNSSHSDRLSLMKFDVSDPKAVEDFYSDLDKKFEKLDVLVNNAGIRKDQIVGMLSEEDWDAVLDINLKGCYLMCKGAVQRMSRLRAGRIINITSPSGRMGFPGQGNYAASKAGMIGFTKSLSKEIAKRKITANCVSPGFIATDLLSDLKDEMLERYKNMIPLGHFGKGEDVASAVLFLASDQASYITGTTLDVTGGM